MLVIARSSSKTERKAGQTGKLTTPAYDANRGGTQPARKVGNERQPLRVIIDGLNHPLSTVTTQAKLCD